MEIVELECAADTIAFHIEKYAAKYQEADMRVFFSHIALVSELGECVACEIVRRER